METIASTKEKPVILVTLLEAGMGHIVSATAIADAIADRYADKVDVLYKHILRESDNPILPKFEQYLIKNVIKYSKYPSFGYIQILAMNLIGSQNSLKVVHHTAMRKQVKALIEEYAKIKPDVIVSTHYFTTYCAVRYRNKYDKNVKVISYCPDNNVHGWWDNRCDMIYTNNPWATQQAYKLKFASGRVKEAFYPTRKAVTEANESKAFYRDKFGIPQNKFAVVVADGVYAAAKISKVCKALLKSDLPLTICLLAGKNDKVIRKFEAMKAKVKPNITLLTFGYINDAPELYRACDLVITKAGPNAILDSVMLDTPVIVNFCATPIEYATKTLFTKRFKCGLFIKSPRKIKAKVEEYVKHPENLQEFADSLAYFDKTKNGAYDIADDIINMIFTPDQHREERFAQEDEVIDRYYTAQASKRGRRESKLYAMDDDAKRQIKLESPTANDRLSDKGRILKEQLHSGRASKKFADILNKMSKRDDENKTVI